LLLNGKEVGKAKPFDESTFISSWDIPYSAGILEVEGLDKEGKVLCSYAIQSSSQPFSIKATSDTSEISSERGLSQILVEITDEKGIPVFLSDNELTCSVSGPVRFLGMESSNNEDMSNKKDNKERVFHGRLVAYFQATGVKGQAKICFTSTWLKSAEVILDVK
jgi:beta-galactosidase